MAENVVPRFANDGPIAAFTERRSSVDCAKTGVERASATRSSPVPTRRIVRISLHLLSVIRSDFQECRRRPETPATGDQLRSIRELLGSLSRDLNPTRLHCLLDRK